MYLEIVSPESTLFSSEVNSVVVPSVDGAFEVLNNHAPIVSLLKNGVIKITTNAQSTVDIENLPAQVVQDSKNQSIFTVQINSGTIEMNANKIIILAD